MTTAPQSGQTLDRWLAWFETVHPKRIDLRLDRFVAVLEQLELRFPPYKIVTVAGTNGKGSCVAMLESIYWHAGYEVGTFTSPHLWRFNERIRVNGVDAADAELVEVFEEVARDLGSVTLSYFEASFVAALKLFRRRDLDVVILEVGMGGRLDATNAVDTDCALIVSIDLDHREWLGDDARRDRPREGRHRAARQARRHRRPSRAAQRPRARGRAGRGAAADRPRLRFSPRGLTLAARERRRVGTVACRCRRSAATSSSRTPLRVRQSSDCCRARCPSRSGRWRPASRQRVLRGRLERHVVDGVDWVFDVGHNPAAAEVLETSLRRLPAAGRTWIVFAAMRDKDLAGVVQPLVPVATGWFVAQASADRGATGAELGTLLESLGAAAHRRGRRRRGRVCRRAQRSGAGRSRPRLRIVSHGGSSDGSASAILRTLPIG